MERENNDTFSLNIMSGGIAGLDLTGEESEVADLAMADGKARGEERCLLAGNLHEDPPTNCSWMIYLVDIFHPSTIPTLYEHIHP